MYTSEIKETSQYYYPFSTPYIVFHGRVITLFSSLPPDTLNSLSEIIQRIIIVVISPFAYLILGTVATLSYLYAVEIEPQTIAKNTLNVNLTNYTEGKNFNEQATYFNTPSMVNTPSALILWLDNLINNKKAGGALISKNIVEALANNFFVTTFIIKQLVFCHKKIHIEAIIAYLEILDIVVPLNMKKSASTQLYQDAQKRSRLIQNPKEALRFREFSDNEVREIDPNSESPISLTPWQDIAFNDLLILSDHPSFYDLSSTETEDYKCLKIIFDKKNAATSPINGTLYTADDYQKFRKHQKRLLTQNFKSPFKPVLDT